MGIYKKSSFFIIYLILTHAVSFAWTGSADSLKKDTVNFVKQKDLPDIFRQVFHLKPASVPNEVKIPGKLLFAVVPGLGYTIQTGFTGVTTFNISFYVDTTDNANLSTIRAAPEASFTHGQILLPLTLDLWSKGNKYNWLGDWHYYKYPTYTFGLGGHSKLSNADFVSYDYIRAYQEVLKQIRPDLFIGLGYSLDIHDNI